MQMCDFQISMIALALLQASVRQASVRRELGRVLPFTAVLHHFFLFGIQNRKQVLHQPHVLSSTTLIIFAGVFE